MGGEGGRDPGAPGGKCTCELIIAAWHGAGVCGCMY